MAVPTYTELAAMIASNAFKDRVAISVSKYAKYILTEDPGTVNHQRRYDWARSAVQNPLGVAASLAYAVAMDAIFTAQNPLNFGTTPDSGAGSVQVAVEATINTTVLTF